MWRRQLACTAQLHAGIQELGLELLVKEPVSILLFLFIVLKLLRNLDVTEAGQRCG